MAEETKTIIMDGGANTVPAYMANGGAFGFGNNTIGDLIGLAIVASIFGWNNGGFGGFGGGNAGGAGFISNQLNNDEGRALIMQAVNSNGEASRAAIGNLATMLGQDYATVNNSLQNILTVLNNIGAQQGMNALQVINEIQRGNSSLTSALQSCCCENRLLTTQQGYEAQIRTLEQTNLLGSQADRNANEIVKAINAQSVALEAGFCGIKERELQQQIDAKNDIIAQLRSQANDQYIINQVAAMIAPLQNQINTVASRQPNTVPVVWPNLTVTPATATVSTGN